MILREILAADAGLEVDAAVAMRVMGWHKDENYPSLWFSDHAEWGRDDWRPSEDMGIAWNYVFAFIMQQKHDVQQAFMSYLQGQATHRDGFSQSGPWLLKALKDVFPLAICRAALWAMASEQERKAAL